MRRELFGGSSLGKVSLSDGTRARWRGGSPGAELTVGNFSDEVGDEEGGGDVGEVVADEFEVFGDTHDGSILRRSLVLVASILRSFVVLTLIITLSTNCIVYAANIIGTIRQSILRLNFTKSTSTSSAPSPS